MTPVQIFLVILAIAGIFYCYYHKENFAAFKTEPLSAEEIAFNNKNPEFLESMCFKRKIYDKARLCSSIPGLGPIPQNPENPDNFKDF